MGSKLTEIRKGQLHKWISLFLIMFPSFHQESRRWFRLYSWISTQVIEDQFAVSMKLSALQLEDYRNRILVCDAILIFTQEDFLFLKKIIGTDWAKFSRKGITNRNITGLTIINMLWLKLDYRKSSFSVHCLLEDYQ